MSEQPPPVGAEPSKEALFLALEITMPECGGDHEPVKLASARSHPETVEWAKRLEAYAAARVAEAVEETLLRFREPPDGDPMWRPSENCKAAIAEARAQEREVWHAAAQGLIDLYVSNRGTKWEFISCVTPRHASAMTPDERAADKVWSLWDALRALAEPQEQT